MLRAHKYLATPHKIYKPRRRGVLDLVTPASYYVSVKLMAVMGVLCIPQMVDGTDDIVVDRKKKEKCSNRIVS
jgi:hypothetical protein